MTPQPITAATGWTVSVDGEPITEVRELTFDGLDHLDDPDGLLDEDIEEVQDATPFVDTRPDATIPEITAAFLRDSTSEEWNAMVLMMQAENVEWRPNLSDQNLYDADIPYRDLRGANFTSATLDEADMSGCLLQDANFTNASLHRTHMTCADVTGSNYSDALSWERARWLNTIGYVAPLVDCTERVARHYLAEAINDPDSIVNDGLRMLVDEGLRAEWRGSQLHFWMAHEVERFIDRCEEGECCCETQHACEGYCDCCACYRGECDCEPDHEHEIEETGSYHLATVIGRVEFDWSDIHGLRGNVKMDVGSRHPHVSAGDGKPCWGDAEMPDTLRVADYLLMVMGWIGQHNPESEYRPITDLPQVG